MYDIYKISGEIQKILQIVNILPHEKLAKFNKLTGNIITILLTINNVAVSRFVNHS